MHIYIYIYVLPIYYKVGSHGHWRGCARKCPPRLMMIIIIVTIATNTITITITVTVTITITITISIIIVTIITTIIIIIIIIMIITTIIISIVTTIPLLARRAQARGHACASVCGCFRNYVSGDPLEKVNAWNIQSSEMIWTVYAQSPY